MNIRPNKLLLALLVGVGLQGTARAGDFYFPTGVGICSGHFEVFDKLEDLYRAAGFQLHDRTLVPVGLSFSPYYEFDCGFGVGLSLGPTAFFEVHEETFGGGGGPGRFGRSTTRDEDKFSYIVPIEIGR